MHTIRIEARFGEPAVTINHHSDWSGMVLIESNGLSHEMPAMDLINGWIDGALPPNVLGIAVAAAVRAKATADAVRAVEDALGRL